MKSRTPQLLLVMLFMTQLVCKAVSKCSELLEKVIRLLTAHLGRPAKPGRPLSMLTSRVADANGRAVSIAAANVVFILDDTVIMS